MPVTKELYFLPFFPFPFFFKYHCIFLIEFPFSVTTELLYFHVGVDFKMPSENTEATSLLPNQL